MKTSVQMDSKIEKIIKDSEKKNSLARKTRPNSRNKSAKSKTLAQFPKTKQP